MKENILDLRAFAPRRKQLVLSESERFFVPDLMDLAFEDFVFVRDMQEQLEQMTDPEKQVQLMIEAVARIIPELSTQRLSKMPMRKIAMIVEFIKRDYAEALGEKPEPEEEAGPLAESEKTTATSN